MAAWTKDKALQGRTAYAAPRFAEEEDNQYPWNRMTDFLYHHLWL